MTIIKTIRNWSSIRLYLTAFYLRNFVFVHGTFNAWPSVSSRFMYEIATSVLPDRALTMSVSCGYLNTQYNTDTESNMAPPCRGSLDCLSWLPYITVLVSAVDLLPRSAIRAFSNTQQAIDNPR